MNSSNQNELCYKSRIGPWNDKDEFLQVYKLLFSPSKTRETQQLAFDMMTVWKLRRHDLTPASVLSTLAILEVQLRDNAESNDWHTLNQLRIFYSTAFTRFLNYMSSIMQNRKFKSMYETAKELGIESFIVDLRHLCAHGQVMPTLETFRRTADYCLNWLHSFYWSREIHVIHDACPQDIRSIVSVNFEEKMKRLFSVYDLVTESIRLKNRFVEDVKSVDFKFDQEIVNLLELYSLDVKNIKLTNIMIHLINDITTVAQRETRTRGNDKIYCSLLFKSKYFMLNAGKLSSLTYNNNSTNNKEERTQENQEASSLINMHQNLFRSVAISGLIPVCFKKLLEICENDHESVKCRSAAAFWANQMATGFIIFKKIKKVFKDRKEKNGKFKIDLAPVNTDEMTKDIKNIYKSLKVNSNAVLIFGDTISHPWSLDFDMDYLCERFVNVNEFTVHVLNKCLILSETKLSADERQHLESLLNIYMAGNTMQTDLLPNNNTEDNAPDEMKKNDSEIYSLDIIMMDNQQSKVSKLDSTNNYGIWSEVSDDYNWQKYPLGRLPWQ